VEASNLIDVLADADPVYGDGGLPMPPEKRAGQKR
jgi:hypothetical protein